MDPKLEVVVVPVSDVDRAKEFYTRLGWREDIDFGHSAEYELVAQGIEVSEVFHDETGIFHHAGTAGRVAGPAAERGSYGSFPSFEDPDGNGWIVQEVTQKAPGR